MLIFLFDFLLELFYLVLLSKNEIPVKIKLKTFRTLLHLHICITEMFE